MPTGQRRQAERRTASPSRRYWKYLEYDCLVNILERVGLESLFIDVPFVCKSWYRASLEPSCWQHIDNPAGGISQRRGHSTSLSEFSRRFIDTYNIKNFSINRLMNLIVSRGFNKSGFLDLSGSDGTQTEKYLQHLVEKCSGVKSLSIADYTSEIGLKHIGKWKQLQELNVELKMQIQTFDGILAQIALHCKEFNSLIVCDGAIEESHALSIAKHVPKIKKLRIMACRLEKEKLEIILGSCKELEYLDVTCYSSHYPTGKERRLKRLASHIKTSNIEVHCWYCSQRYFGKKSYWDSELKLLIESLLLI